MEGLQGSWFQFDNRGGLYKLLITMRLEYSESPRGSIAFRKTTCETADRSFDLAFWQAQTPAVRFQAAWEMACLAWELKGKSADELRLQRTVSHIKRS